ncbi:MAG: hypothetical protein HY428_01095 [Candidatus Levybacteria bacterium]|nr:hypothetical protein [Candidatus Levybacteria bacterium]
MQQTVLQVPVSKQLKTNAEKAALSHGFASLQEAVRIFLTRLAGGSTLVTFEEEETIVLSEKASKRYEKMDKEIESGKVKTEVFHDVDSIMEYLDK